MTYEALLRQGVEALQAARIAEASIDAMYLLEDICGMNRMNYLMNQQTKVDEGKIEVYMHKIEIRAKHVPLQHILGKQEFMGYEFVVNENVLIPRQDTEILVEEASKVAEGKRVLDLCTGSGCIILSLAKLCHLAEAVAVDLSPKALEVARENNRRLQGQVTFVESDLFSKVEGSYDVIVSNPPYIETEVIEGLMEEVRDHEPKMALDGGADGLVFYRRLVEEAPMYLANPGYLFFEIGCDQGEAVKELMEDRGFTNCRVVKDLAGLDRVVTGLWSVEHG